MPLSVSRPREAEASHSWPPRRQSGSDLGIDRDLVRALQPAAIATLEGSLTSQQTSGPGTNPRQLAQRLARQPAFLGYRELDLRGRGQFVLHHIGLAMSTPRGGRRTAFAALADDTVG
jgi:hypothetical protein